MSKNLLMLGCGIMQGVAIRCAKEKGWTVFGVDGNKNAINKKLCDFFEPIDLKDVESLINYAKKIQLKYGLDGVFTAATDFSLSVAQIAESCKLPSHSVKAAEKATDKLKMRHCFKENKVPSPNYFEINKENLIKIEHEFIKSKLNFPLVVKPADNMGSRGCKRVETIKELKNATIEAISFSKTSRVIVEEFMDGKEYSIEALVFDEKIIITGLADRHIKFPPFFVEMGHTMPTNSNFFKQQRLIDVFKKGIKSLGLTWGVAKGDLKLTKKGVMVGEIAARLSGGYMSGWTYPYSTGVLLTSYALDLAVGNCPKKIKNKQNWVSAERAWISIPGVISKIEGIERANTLPYIKNVFPRYSKGDKVVFPQNNVEKCGNCISLAPNRKKAIKFSTKAVQEIFIRLEPNNENTNNFLENTTNFPPFAFNVKNISKNTKFCKHKDFNFLIPKQIIKKFNTSFDWHGKSLKSCLTFALKKEKKLESFLNKSQKLLKIKAWNALLRGGIQGIIYFYDSNKR